jgi:hypothetical protein
VDVHGVIILNTLLVTMFLYIEARRYRYYELWSSRVRLMETDFFSAMLVPPFRPGADWAETLAENLLYPRFPISIWEAVGRRYRRNFVWIYMLLVLAWVLKIAVSGETSATTWAQIVERAAIGPIPGLALVTLGALFNGALLAVGLLTMGLKQASGEILPRYGAWSPDFLATTAQQRLKQDARAWFRPSRRRQQLLTLVITDRGRTVSERILDEMRRGVTELSGRGMFTGERHSVLMCALTATEVPKLESLVKEADPNAFVIVTPVQEVLGSGFAPLDEDRSGPLPIRGGAT